MSEVMPYPPRDALLAAVDRFAASDHSEAAATALVDAVTVYRSTAVSYSSSEVEHREYVAREVERYAVRVESMCHGLQATRDALVAAHDHADQQMWGACLPWPALLMIAMLPALWRDLLVPVIAAATHQSDPRFLTLRPGNWVRLTNAMVDHLRLHIDDVVVTSLHSDGTVIIRSVDDWISDDESGLASTPVV